MSTKIFTPILTLIFIIFFSVSIFAVPPSEEVIQKLKDEGRFDQFLENMAAARANGVNAGLVGDGKGVSKLSLSTAETFRVLVILIDFDDKPYTAGWTAGTVEDFDSLLFSDGLNPTGSMSEFYYENSYGNFVMEGDVVGWYRAAENSSYYTNFCDGSRGMGTYPNNSKRLVEEAVDMADADVDFSIYDNDGNGYVDGIFVVHAGTGYEESSNDCEIHSHQWNITPRYVDGVYVSAYSVEPEESPGSQGLIPIGVFCHEFGHVLGLPDLYDTDYSSRGAGAWALMASGSYNGFSKQPSHFTIWSKIQLGWMSATTVGSNQTDIEIPAIEWNSVGYKLWKNGSPGSEYFLVENRQKMGFDAALPSSGVLIWHIDQNVGGNSNDWHPKVFLEQADGLFDLQNNTNGGDGGDPFRAGGASSTFHDKTTPNSKAYNTSSTEVAAWNISANDSIMTADFDVSWSRPYLYFVGYNFSDDTYGNGNGVLEAGETIELTATIANDWKSVASSDITLTVDDGTLNITTGNVPLGSIPSGGWSDNNSSPLVFEIPADYTPRIDSFYLEINSDGGAYTNVLAIEQNVGKPAVMIVDDDDGDNLETYYSGPLYGKRVPYDVWNVSTSGSPSSSDLNNYDGVIWYTGDDRVNPLSSPGITAMQAYLDAGGGLFLTGQGIADQLSTSNPSFLSNYLKASYMSTSLVPLLSVDAGSQAFNGLGNIVITGAGGAGNQTAPDHISAVNGGVGELLFYGTTDLAAVSYSGAYKMMFFSFGMEAIVNGDYRFVERDTVLAHVLDFLGVSTSTGFPEVHALGFGPGAAMNLTDHTPTLSWDYYDADGTPQEQYHIQVGSDDDWASAEFWDYGPISSSDTSVDYSGMALADGQYCYVRVQTYNGTQWSNWYSGQFRMNSVPGMPSGLLPDAMTGVTDATPALQINNASDGESDALTYDYEVYSDSLLTSLIDQTSGQAEGSSTSSWSVSVTLTEDMPYYWRARAYDGFEAGDWTSAASFWVNATNQAPDAFDLMSPEDSSVVSETVPTFHWTKSFENDLYDDFTYTFMIDTSMGFATANTIAGLTDTFYTTTDTLQLGMIYYWKVQAADNFGGVTESGHVFMLSTLASGDANLDGLVNVGDVVFLINYIFRGGVAPDPLAVGDANGDCICDVGDAVYLINFIFRDGEAPRPGCAK